MTKSDAERLQKIETNTLTEDEIDLIKKEKNYLKIELEYLKKLKSRGLKDPRENNTQD